MRQELRNTDKSRSSRQEAGAARRAALRPTVPAGCLGRSLISREFLVDPIGACAFNT
jgi:hypothetical protein